MTALILGAAALLMGAFDLFVGRNLFNRPLLTGTVVGLILGDVQAGMMIGAILELAFIGLFAVGAAIPPEILTGGILGTALAISSGGGAETALLLAFPIAAVGLLVKNLHFGVISPLFLHKADKYAEQANFRGLGVMHVLSGIVQMTLLALLVGVGYAAGNEAVSAALDAVPEQIITGLRVATGILPALGFALLARMIMSRRVMPYFFLGFLAVAYTGLPVVAVAAIGTMIAWIMVGLESRRTQHEAQPADAPAHANATAGDDDDDF